MSHRSLKVTTTNNPTLPVEKFPNILYANYFVKCFHRCELPDSTAAIQKDKKGVDACEHMHVCVGRLLPNSRHVISAL